MSACEICGRPACAVSSRVCWDCLDAADAPPATGYEAVDDQRLEDAIAIHIAASAPVADRRVA